MAETNFLATKVHTYYLNESDDTTGANTTAATDKEITIQYYVTSNDRNTALRFAPANGEAVLSVTLSCTTSTTMNIQAKNIYGSNTQGDAWTIASSVSVSSTAKNFQYKLHLLDGWDQNATGIVIILDTSGIAGPDYVTYKGRLTRS